MEDERRIEAVLAGDREAFGPLMDRYYAMVYRVCLNMTCNAPDAVELAHDSFVEAYLKLGQLREPSRFGGWLRTLTLNVCRMWYRDQQRLVELDEDQIPAVEDVPEDKSIYARMSHGLSGLSVPHRLVLVLHYYEELSYDEIATFLDIPQGTVMSRLHRARNALKEAMEQMSEYEEIPAVPDDRFKEVVQAEIAVLLRMFHDEPNALERLSVVLRKTPERLVELIVTTGDPVDNLAILLPHLGAGAIDIVLDCRFSRQEPMASNARAILCRYAARCGTMGHRDGMPDIASRDAYSFLDGLMTHPASDMAKAEALIEMADACQDPNPRVLFANALLCYEDEAFPLVMRRFEEAGRPPWLLQALVRTGAQFGERLLEMLRSGNTEQQGIALPGLEAVARSLAPVWLDGASRERFLNEVRTREKWPPLCVDDIGSGLIACLTRETASIVAQGPRELRSQAIRVLGHLRAGEHAALVRGCLSDAAPATRLAAIFALSEIGDADSSDALVSLARDGEPQERAASVTALGHLKMGHAEHLLVRMTSDEDVQVREAAVVALGEMGTVSSQVALQELMRGGDGELRKIAARAAFGGVEPRMTEPSEIQKRLAEKRRKLNPVAFISPDAAIRFGLTEMRSYDERDLSNRIARVCIDHCATRRYMVELGLMIRSSGRYEFTESGKAMWRVERFIFERYLTRLCRETAARVV